MSSQEGILLAAALTLFAAVLLYIYRPSTVKNGTRTILRGVLRALLMVGILLAVTYLGFSVLHFKISAEWTRTIIAFTIAGFFAGSLGKAIFDRVWPED